MSTQFVIKSLWCFQRFDGMLPLFLFIFTLIEQKYNTIFIYITRRVPFLLSTLHPLGCRAEIRTRTCRTASRRATIWATPHPKSLWCCLLVCAGDRCVIQDGRPVDRHEQDRAVQPGHTYHIHLSHEEWLQLKWVRWTHCKDELYFWCCFVIFGSRKEWQWPLFF